MDCIRCLKKIGDNEKRVRITTFMVDKTSKDEWFHWNCWLDYFKDSVYKKSKEVIGLASGISTDFLKNYKENVNKIMEEIKNFNIEK